MLTRATLVLLAVVTTATSSAMAGPTPTTPTYDLVSYRTCLAGSWGTSTVHEWRVQFGVFAGGADPEVLGRRFAALGIPTEAYLAAWLSGDDEPLVVVSRSYRTRAAAERAGRRYRAKVSDAVVRPYVRWTR